MNPPLVPRRGTRHFPERYRNLQRVPCASASERQIDLQSYGDDRSHSNRTRLTPACKNGGPFCADRRRWTRGPLQSDLSAPDHEIERLPGSHAGAGAFASPTDRASGTFDTTDGDSIVGEYRGSAIVERYLNPNQTGLPDFATTFPGDPTSTVDNYVKYRVVNTHAFAP